MGMGFIDSFPFSLGSFAILDDLDDCSSTTDTYVERKRSTASANKSKSKAKQSTTTISRALANEAVSKRADVTSRVAETARSTTVANLNVDGATKPHGAATNISAKHSVANETAAKRSTATAPAAPGHEPSRRPKHEKRDEGGERKNETTRIEQKKGEQKKDETIIEVQTITRETTRSASRSQAPSYSQGPSRAPPISEVGTKVDVSTEELRKENRALRRRAERLEKDLAAYRRHAEHYRDRRREADRERLKAEERAKDLEIIVTNMRESYELELDDLRTQLTEYAAKAAAAASATQLFAKDITGQTEERPAASVHEQPASVRAPSVIQVARDMHELSVQTDPVLAQELPPRPTAPLPGALPPIVEDAREISTLLAKLELQGAELQALKLFHDETPQIPLDTLTSSVRTLNTELRNLATAMASSIPLGRTWEVAQAWALEAAEPSLARCLRLLSGVKGADFAEDTTLVRLALQGWIVSCLQRVFEKFLFGLENSEDEMLRRVFERVQARESPAIAARWRALARLHARTLAMPPVSSPTSPSATFSAARDHAVHLLEMDILVGAESLLRFAGAHSPPGVLLAELSTAYGRRISRVVRRAAKLASDLAERAPVGCEVFTVAEEAEHGHARGGGGVFLCGCMESVDQECRQWIGKTHHENENDRRTRGTRTRTHTRAGTVRNKSKTRSHARSATTYADTNTRYWRAEDSDKETEDDDSEEEEEDTEGNGEEDIFVESPRVHITVDEEGYALTHETVMCSLGFGLRRVLRGAKRKDEQEGARGPRIQHSTEDLQRERRRVPKPQAQAIRTTNSRSEAKSTYTIKLSTVSSSSPSTPTSASSHTERQKPRNRQQHSTADHESHAAHQDEQDEQKQEEGREVEVLVKTDVLMSSTVDLLRKRVVRSVAPSTT
ncbi:uncharacterized protein FOMMEDRAFT_165575 [Fomitiporia mediterranea MF3/22]|uniref:uncharacterized protein n=1 Tax=Fomitiporia mediterranea (strain MF3/22) TaxID=694068 RepID=UPI0004407824|nr:uncharacterized protein FOMMEDRAFT_165575 [Fomitiporia mediterranea MF3/22]EJD06908.1 hypothetical protein FOMMEDRAFT_165575 [Fomitiporia mediterranea MF3/22]